MIKQDNGGPAFPLFVPAHSIYGSTTYFGASLRDFFAMHASHEDVESMILKVPTVERVKEIANGNKVLYIGPPDNARQIARYMVADAMLAARK